jgi:hypothetical protein
LPALAMCILHIKKAALNSAFTVSMLQKFTTRNIGLCAISYILLTGA